jgi:CheY-like chemotaxis protein
MNRDMLSRRLRGRGYAVALAHDGQQALDAIARQPFDLMLDVSMPEISGLQFLEPFAGRIPWPICRSS